MARLPALADTAAAAADGAWGAVPGCLQEEPLLDPAPLCLHTHTYTHHLLSCAFQFFVQHVNMFVLFNFIPFLYSV